MSVRIITGDCIEMLWALPAESVHCCVTSPPYWGLRDYGIPPSVWGGDPDCQHEWSEKGRKGGGSHTHTDGTAQTGHLHMAAHEAISNASTGQFCACGAWRGATQPFSEAHFATFPPKLIEPCILAGCTKGGVVLDPFGGAMTTSLVADRLQRNSISIELNPSYVAMGTARIKSDGPLFCVFDEEPPDGAPQTRADVPVDAQHELLPSDSPVSR